MIVDAYLQRLRERYPMPRWIAGGNRFGPESLPTHFTLDAVVSRGKLTEWRVVHDPLARGAGSSGAQLRSSSPLAQLVHSGTFGALKTRLEDLTVHLDRDRYFRCNDENLLLVPPWADGLKQNVDAVRVADLVMAGSAVVLTGPLGSGKSTFCRWMANKLATARIHDPSAILPIFVDLRLAATWLPTLRSGNELLTMHDLARAAMRSLDVSGEPDELVAAWNSHAAFLLVDGLDEVGVVLSQRAAVPMEDALARTLQSLAASNPQVLVSSRPNTRGLEVLSDFLEVEFAPLTVSESVEILQGFLDGTAGAPDSAQVLATAIPRELRTRPLFLSLIGQLQADGILPDQRTRWAILDASLKELLSARVIGKHGRETVIEVLGCDYQTLVSELQRAAYEAEIASVADGGALTIDLGTLTSRLYQRETDTDINQVLKVLTREAGLMVRHDGELEFTHRAFQDLLAAAHLADSADRRGDRNHSELLEALRTAPHVMREVAELYVERQSGIDRVNHMLDLCNASLEAASSVTDEHYGGICIWLTAIGLREIARENHVLSRRDAVVVEDFVERAAPYIGNPSLLGLADRVLIAEQLGQWGDQRNGVGLDESGLPSHDWIEVDGRVAKLGLDAIRAENLASVGIANVAREIPEVEVEMPRFWISKFPTTWTQFRSFLHAEDGYADSQWWGGWDRSGSDWGSDSRLRSLVENSSLGNCPAVGVDWHEVSAYCRWVTDKLQMPIDLPTEEEWETAARGHSGALFPWGEEFDPELANWAGSGLGRVIPVGCFAEPPDGSQPIASDFIGNVWEWTRSLADDSATGALARIDSTRHGMAPAGTVRRVVRGGCYLNELPLLRATYRGVDFATARFARQGFRVVLHEMPRSVDS